MAPLKRHLATALMESLTDSPVVFIQGARQTGKSTLAQSLAPLGHPARYLTLDDAGVLSAAKSDPQGFIAGLDGKVIIDEMQRAPELALAIKSAVDIRRVPGRFLLTGSANFLLLPKLAESLAGRIEIHMLWPLSQGEMARNRDNLVDAVFRRRFTVKPGVTEGWQKLAVRLARGGFPEILQRKDAERRAAWFGSYINTILQRDVRDIANIRDLSEFPRLLRLVAGRACSLVDYAGISRDLAMPQTTLKRYMGLLEATFLVQTIPPWSVNTDKRLVKSPKLLLNDSGLLVYLLGCDVARLRRDPMTGGKVLENFVAMELLKQRGWSKAQPNLFHFRTHGGDEVDLVLESKDGRVSGIEVKASATVTSNDFKGLKALAEVAGDRFVRGIVLYAGETVVPFARNLLAIPVSSLWNNFVSPDSQRVTS